MRFSPGHLVRRGGCGVLLAVLLLACAPVRAEEGQKPASAAVLPDFDALAHAKRLRLTKGSNYPVCRDVLANLNLLPSPAMGRGEMPIDPRFKLLRKPDWQTVDLKEHRDIIKRFWVNRQKPLIPSVPPSTPPLSPEEMDAAIDAEIASGHALLQRVVLDFDHDGYQDEVFRYSNRESQQGEKGMDYNLPGRYWKLAVNTGEPRGNIPETDFQLTKRWGLDVFLHDGRVFTVFLRGLGMVTVFEPFYLPSSRQISGTGHTTRLPGR